MPTNFEERKARIIRQLDVPETEYNDLSPKGTVDVGIRQLLGEINAVSTLATTSSCAGRTSVYVEGQKSTAKATVEPSTELVSGAGGKGGGYWLFVSHDPVKSESSLCKHFGLKETNAASSNGVPAAARLIHFKFEAMVCTNFSLHRFRLNLPQILHLLSASLTDASKVLAAASAAGFRESGAMGLSANKDGSVTPMVAVRSNGLGLDSIIGYINRHEEPICIVSEEHLHLLNTIANKRFEVNTERIERFHQALLAAYAPVEDASIRSGGSDYEDPVGRKARKRAEGLARQEALGAKKSNLTDATVTEELHFPD
jgi:tRNA wybutosine-synthesizing protein 3